MTIGTVSLLLSHHQDGLWWAASAGLPNGFLTFYNKKISELTSLGQPRNHHFQVHRGPMFAIIIRIITSLNHQLWNEAVQSVEKPCDPTLVSWQPLRPSIKLSGKKKKKREKGGWHQLIQQNTVVPTDLHGLFSLLFRRSMWSDAVFKTKCCAISSNYKWKLDISLSPPTTSALETWHITISKQNQENIVIDQFEHIITHRCCTAMSEREKLSKH